MAKKKIQAKTSQRKGRLPRALSNKKRKEAKRMYVKNGLSLQEIAEICEVHIDSVRRWHRIDKWEQEKNLQIISIEGLKQELLNTYNTMKSGETPNMTPDQIAKLVSAFDKLEDKNKNLAYCMQNYDLLTDKLIEKVSEATVEKEKKRLMDLTKFVRELCNEVVTDLYKEVVNE